jgi:transposase
MEHLYTPAEVAKILRVSEDTVYRIFEREKGVILLESASRLAMPKAEARKLGRYRTLRIPEIVLRRVLDRYRVQ